MSTEHEALVKEYLQLQEQAEHIDQRKDAIKAELRTLGEGSHDLAGVKVSIAPNRRIDAALVAEQYPVEQHPELWKAAPDTTAIRKNLAPIRVEQLMSESGEPKVSIR